jgi:TldD protein
LAADECGLWLGARDPEAGQHYLKAHEESGALCYRRSFVGYAPRMHGLCRQAIEAALGAGASYADARAIARRSQLVMTKNGEVETVSDTETEGIGVRVLVDGAWGFACDRRLEDAGARDAAQRAAAFARAAPGSHERELAPLEPQTGRYRTEFEHDPVEVPLSDKIALCLRADEAMKHDDVKVRTASVRAVREEKVFV